MPVRNPFRAPILAKTYAAMLKAYAERHHDLIRASGERHMGNGFASAFWRGYDGLLVGRWDAQSRQTPSYACWRAGHDTAKPVKRATASQPVLDQQKTA